MKHLIISLVIPVFFLNAASAFAIQKTGGDKKVVLATVGKEEITLDDIQHAYNKNMNRSEEKLSSLPKDSILGFLNLYIRYRLKVQDAIDRGYDKDPEIMKEIADNRRMAAETFYYEKNLLNPTIDELAERMKREVKIAYIIFNFPMGVATPEADKPKAGAQEALDRLKKGENFAKIAAEYSSDKATGEKGGVIDQWIAPGKLQRELESEIYKLKKGEYTDHIVQTDYGYFIIKVIDESPRYMIKAAHILLEQKGDTITEELYARAEQVLNELKGGKDFAEVAKAVSEDPVSAANGGELSEWYSRSSGYEKSGKFLDNVFTGTLYSLKDGEISGIVRTDYGLHIIKRIATRNFDPEKDRKDMTEMYKRVYYPEDKPIYLDSVSRMEGFSIDESALRKVLAAMDTNKTNLDTAWTTKITPETMNATLFSIGSRKFTVRNFVDFSNDRKNSQVRGLPTNNTGVRKTIKLMKDPVIIDRVTEGMEEKYPEFGRLYKEFHDGILLFKVESEEVWNKVKFDSVVARKYYDTTSIVYTTDLMYDISEIFVLEDSLANDLKARIDKGEDFGLLAAEHTQRSGYREKKGNWGLLNSRKNKFASMIDVTKIKEGDIIGPRRFETGLTIIKINSVEMPRKKTFEEAVPEIAPVVNSLIQQGLQENWLNKIKAKHPVKINNTEIEKIAKK